MQLRSKDGNFVGTDLLQRGAPAVGLCLSGVVHGNYHAIVSPVGFDVTSAPPAVDTSRSTRRLLDAPAEGAARGSKRLRRAIFYE